MRKLGLVVGLAACGGHSSVKPDALAPVDGAPDSSAAPGPNVVTITVFDGTPSLVTYRDGAGPWLVPTTNTMGDYLLHVTNDFQFVVVCSDSTGFASTLQNATYAELAQLFMPCIKNAPAPPATVTVTGQMTQPGTIDMYDTAASTTGPWNFSLNVPTGTHDLVAYDDTNILIRRNQAIAGPTTTTTVDLAQGGAMTPVQLTINGRVSGDTLNTNLDLLLSNDVATLIGTSTTLLTPPGSLLLSSDYVFLFAEVQAPTTYRYVDAQFFGA